MAGGRGWMMAAGLALAGLALAGVAAVPARAAPTGYPVTGIDVSAYQGQVNWASVAAGGADGQTLPPMLDIEWPRADWTGLDAGYNMTPAQMSAWIRDFVREVAARTGQRAMIYTSTNWWNPCTGNDATFGSYPLFIARYAASPRPLPAGWATWTLWQYSSSGTLPGDQDVFSGDQAGLARLAGAAPVSLRAHANGRYVTAEQAGSLPLTASRTAIGSWESFYRTTG